MLQKLLTASDLSRYSVLTAIAQLSDLPEDNELKQKIKAYAVPFNLVCSTHAYEYANSVKASLSDVLNTKLFYIHHCPALPPDAWFLSYGRYIIYSEGY